MCRSQFAGPLIGALVLLAWASLAKVAKVQILLPLGRTAYQTKESIDVSVVRSDTLSLAPGSGR